MQSMLKDWTDKHTAGFQKDIITFKHGLNETGLFSDEALSELLDRHPNEQLDVCTMGDIDDPRYPNRFRTGDFRGVDGDTLIKAVRAGRIWINLRKAMNIHPEYKAVLDQMYGGIAEATGRKTYNANGGILISSPIAKVPYHFDKTETILWHIRGRKRIYLYPVTEDFIPDEAYENSLINRLDDDIPYYPEFDSHAKVFDLEPGQAITWPLSSPHRVDNQEFCVSVTTEYSTRESGFKNAAMLANATLRQKFGGNPTYSNAGPINRNLKSVFGRVVKKAGLAAIIEEQDMVSFKVDKSVPGYVIDLEPFERNF